MSTEIRTERVHRTWLDKLLFWKRAYQTRVFDEHREARGRGPTAEASKQAALSKWVSEGEVETEEPTE
jgi:hypothetical protein